MPSRIRFAFATLSLVFSFVAAAPVNRELSQRSDVWRTPKAMLLPLAESTDWVEIYARGKPLAALIQAGQLQLAEQGITSPAVTKLTFLWIDHAVKQAAQLKTLLTSRTQP